MPDNKLRVFDVLALKKFSNFEAIKRYVVISETRPHPDQIRRENEKVMLITEQMNTEVIILK